MGRCRRREQGKRQPSGAARTLLRIMEREPEAVLRALSREVAESDETRASPAASH